MRPMRVTEPVPQLSEVETILRRRSATTATAALSTLVAVGFGCSGSVVTHTDSSSSNVASVTSSGGGGNGGAGGGAGGDACIPEPNPCDSMPPGTCWDWQDSCGTSILCGENACGDTLTCDPPTGLCVCGDASVFEEAVAICEALGHDYAPLFCGDDVSEDTPVGCAMTGRTVSGYVLWCCLS